MSRYYDSDGERIDAPSRAEALADAIALGDLEPSVTPEPDDSRHVCWQDSDPWCPSCGPALREWLRGYSGPFGKSRGAA